jgi:YegS/Rv2252/BmrU family lipid kinase
MKAIIIHNPIAGQRTMSDEVQQVAHFLTGEGWYITGIEVTRGPGDATTFARKAAAECDDVVVVAGGDGTIAQVVDGLVGTETALAVLPGGSGNVMARQLNLPVPGGLPARPLLDAARLTLQGQIRRIDVGRMSFPGHQITSRHFICWSGVGFDAMFNKTANRDRDATHRLSNGALFAAAFYTLKDFAGTSAVVRVDGERVSRRLLQLVASNIQVYGLYFKMAPRALLDDGYLDIYCFQGDRAGQVFRHLGEMLVNRHIQNPQVDSFRARRVEISTARPLLVHVDGDCIGETPVVIEVVPHALNLLVPRSAPTNLFTDASGLPPDETTFDRVKRRARDAQAAIKERSHLP